MLYSLNLSAQNLRRVEGSVKDRRGNPIAGATIQVVGSNMVFSSNNKGTFSIDIPHNSNYIIAHSSQHYAKKLEIDGAYMIFTLRPKTQEGVAWMKQQAQLTNQKEAETNAKAEEQARIAAQKEAEAKAKTEELIRIAEEKRAAKREERISSCLDKNIRSLQYLKLEQPADTYTNMGKDYFFGRNGKEFNIAKAFLCYNLGAKQGEAEAFVHIALYYETGRSYERFYLEKDLDLALDFYKKAESLNVQGASERIKILQQSR